MATAIGRLISININNNEKISNVSIAQFLQNATECSATANTATGVFIAAVINTAGSLNTVGTGGGVPVSLGQVLGTGSNTAGINFTVMSDEWCCGHPYLAGGMPDKAVTFMEHTLAAAEKLGVKQVAATTGYADIAQFSKLFKKKIGLSPRAYRDALPQK